MNSNLSRGILICALMCGCEGVLPGFDWQQMNQQHKFQAFEACSYFLDGRAMQTPPLGTVPRNTPEADLDHAATGSTYLTQIPVPLTRELFDRGRFGFETYCAACHGGDGSGDSEVARNMDLRKAPSLVDEPVRSFPPGRIYQVASQGYGLMPAFANELTPLERWGTVAYLMALQRSRSVKLDDLPRDLRSEAAAALKERAP